MTKTRPKPNRIVAFQLTDHQEQAMAKVQLPHVNRSSLLKRALDVGLERAIREMTRAVVAEERN